MAEAFPRRRSPATTSPSYALDRAEAKLAEAGLTNARFADPRGSSPCRRTTRVDLVTTFDCIHDMTHPQEMMEAIRAAIADDGTWLLVDIKALDTFAENVAQEPDGRR